jgi:hypothetical protein
MGVAAFIKTFSAFVRERWDRWFCSEAIAAALGLPEPASMNPQALDDAITKGEKIE